MAEQDQDKIEVDSYPPWNFSWVVPDQLAVMAHPRNVENMKWIEEQGIKHLITLSPEKRPPLGATPNVQWSEIAIDEFADPSIKQIKAFIETCQRCQLKHEPIGIHCRHGRGRSGVMAACYLVYFQELPPERALINLRLMRPGSVETEEQERAVLRYHDCLRGIKDSYELPVDG